MDAIHAFKRVALFVACAVLPAAFAVEFSKAGYWEAGGSPRRVETLTTGWEFSLDGFKTSRHIALPHCIDEGELGIEASGCVNRQQPVWYRRRFAWKRNGACQFLHFEAIMGKSRVTLNGRLVAEHFGGYLPIHAEVTGVLKDGENLLEVWCDNSNDPGFPPGKPQYALDFAYFGGIYRDAYLIETGEAYVADSGAGGVRITSNLGRDGKWTVRADVTLGGETDGATAELFYDGARVESPFRPESPALWSPESPNLHWLRVDVRKDGLLTDSVRVRFGIRDFSVGMDGLTLNGRPYSRKLIGANRHQDYAFIGNALPNSLHWRDVKKFKDCGMTVFRASHYPQDPAFMDACDELGMFVVVQVPGWQFWNKGDPAFEQRACDDIEKMVRRDRSRPSLFMWEPLLNETDYVPGRFVTNAVAIVKRETLPPNGLCLCDERMRGSDLYDVNCSGARQNAKRPTFRREWADGGYVDNWNAQNSISRICREWGETPMVEQAKHHMRTLGMQLDAPSNHLGGCLWHGTDHARGGHPDNFYGGIMTYARQKKYSYFAFKAALTEKPFVFLAHELSVGSPEEVPVYSNCVYTATLLDEPFVPGVTRFDRDRIRLLDRGGKRDKKRFTATLVDGSMVEACVALRHAKVVVALDTEGLAPVADGGDLVAVTATLSDVYGTPKRYETETVRFSVEGEADIVGTNPQVTRWGEAVVLVRPRAAANPRPIKVRAELVRKGRNVPAAGVLSFTPGSLRVGTANAPQAFDDPEMRDVERRQRALEVKD